MSHCPGCPSYLDADHAWDECQGCPACTACAEKDHDLWAYRGALGYPVPGFHDGRLTDGTTPVNGIAEAMTKRIAELERILNGTIQTAGKKALEDEARIDVLNAIITELEAELEGALNANANRLG